MSSGLKNLARNVVIDIRPMDETDLAAVLVVDATGSSPPWSAAQLRSELANPVASIDLALIGGAVAGYLCAWLVAGELEIHNLVTAPACRRRGVAWHLLDHRLRMARQQRVERVLLEVRVGNGPAIALYRAYGFVDCGVRRGYYPDGEDALLMEMTVGPLNR